MRFGGLVTLALYLGIGALCHGFMVGPQFDWSSAWTWGWLLGWPAMLFVAFWTVILGLLIFALVVSLFVIVWEMTEPWRTRRAAAKAAANRRRA